MQLSPCLRLCGFQFFGLAVLVEERGDLGIETGAESAQRGVASRQRLSEGDDGSQGGESWSSLGHFAELRGP